MIKKIPNFRSRALRSSLETSIDSQHKSKDEESSSPLISSSGTSDCADQFSIEIPDKYISSLPYLTRQLNRKIWQNYQGGYK